MINCVKSFTYVNENSKIILILPFVKTEEQLVGIVLRSDVSVESLG